MAKKSFNLYKSWYPLIEALYSQSPENAGMLFVAIMAYQNDGTEPEISSPIYSHFCLMKQKFEEDNKAYEDACESYRENGKRGGRPKKPNETKNNQSGFSETKAGANLTKHNQTKPDTDTDTVTDTDTDTVKDIKGDRANAEPLPFIDYEEVVKEYNSICVSLPRVTTISDARKKAIRARVKAYGTVKINKAFVMAEESDFLKGSNNRNWIATFDWIMSDRNMAKILDGNYANKGKSPPQQDGFEWLSQQIKEGGFS